MPGSQGNPAANDQEAVPEAVEEKHEIEYPSGMNVVNNTGCAKNKDAVEIPHIIHQSWKDSYLPLVLKP
jgi:hypothetical protein